MKIEAYLTLKDLENFLEEDPPPGETEILAWRKKDKKARATIGLSLSDDLLENVREVKTTKEMWLAIKNIFERHTLLNKLSARKKFYTATKSENESILQFSNRIRYLASTLKSMNVSISGSEMAMALLNGLPEDYNALISALDAIDEDETELDFEFIKSRIMQEEQRIKIRTDSAREKSEAAALLASQTPHNSRPRNSPHGRHGGPRRRPFCTHCRRLGHIESKCWTKYPNLDPRNNGGPSKPALIASLSDEDPVVCLMANSQNANLGKWVIDSGCSNHMTFNKSLFSYYTAGHPSSVDFGNNNTAEVAGIGTVEIPILVEGKKVKCQLKNVMHVPALGYQLLSVPTFDKLGLTTSFHSKRCQIYNGEKLLATATMKGNLYELDTYPTSKETALVGNSIEVWHHRLAHIQPSTILEMSKSQAVQGLNIENSSRKLSNCTGCVLGKGHRAPIPKKSDTRAQKPLELVHSDVNGPLDITSLGGSRYFVTFIDDFSRWTSLFTMKTKSEVFECFKRFHAYAEKHTGARIGSVNVIKRTSKTAEELKAIRTDNGGEYISNEFKSYLLKHGIQHQLTVAYTPQQNGVAERMNRTLLDCVRSLLHTAKLDKKFWAEALATAVYIRNRMVSRSLPKHVTPHQRWMGKEPDLSHLRVFGCKCWFVLPKFKVKKLDARSKEGLMMGYSTQSKGYKIWDIESARMIVSRDVTFNEQSVGPSGIELPLNGENSSNIVDPGGAVKEEVDDNIDSTQVSPTDNESSNNDNSDSDFEDAQDSPKQPLRRSARISQKTGEWWKSKGLLAQALIIGEVPTSFKVATSPENLSFWTPGIDREHDCLVRNHTWNLVDYNPGMKVLPCKYVFKVKNSKPKVRLVALGCRQTYGIDYNETYAPVVSLTTVRTILATVAYMDLELEQMDVVTAFLNGDLHEDVYMRIPEGLSSPDNAGKVCKLRKSLYGLKQSPRQWYAKMHEFLVNELQFVSSPNDPCLYTQHKDSNILIIALYVDDLLIAGNSKSDIETIKKELSNKFEMKDLGNAKIMLGIEIRRDRKNRQLFVSQSEYTSQILDRFGMADSKHVSTPMNRTYQELINQGSPPAENVPYRQAIGSLMYLMIGSRPDLAFVIGKLSQHAEKPSEFHWISVKRALRYVNATRNHGILYDGNKPLETKGFSDADWAGCRVSRKSTSGFVFLVAGGAVSWRSKKQTCVATSTCEAEYIAMCMACKESIWLSRLFSDLKNSQKPEPITLGVDNNGAIDTAKNAIVNQRNKHIDLQYHFVRNAQQTNQIKLQHVTSENQLADSLTKPLDRILFSKLTIAQGICNAPF